MVSRLTHWASVLGAYARDGEDGLADLADSLEDAAHDRPGGKFSKSTALYSPQAPMPPTLWRTSCGRCRFYEEGEPGEPGTCHVVGQEDDRFGGEAIHYRGWCAFWMPPAGEPALAWAKERLNPDGKASARGEYDPAMTVRERARQQRPPDPGTIREHLPGGGGDADGEREENTRRNDREEDARRGDREEDDRRDDREEVHPDGG